MDNVTLRQEVVAKFNARSVEFNALVASVKQFAIDILVDCKDVINEIPDAKTLAFLIIDEIDDRTNTGLIDAVDGVIAKGIFEKWVESPNLEAEYSKLRATALAQIAANTQAGV